MDPADPHDGRRDVHGEPLLDGTTGVSDAAVTAGCPTCGAAQAGNFCAECGQRLRSGQLSLRQITVDGVAELTDLEHGLPRTPVRRRSRFSSSD
jgi:hypothetical protein